MGKRIKRLKKIDLSGIWAYMKSYAVCSYTCYIWNSLLNHVKLWFEQLSHENSGKDIFFSKYLVLVCL